MSRTINDLRELILSTSSNIAHEEGLSAINMRRVAKECDIALGTIYNYFPNKMDLIVAIIEDFWNNCFKEFHHAYDPNLDFFKQLEVLYFYMFNYLEQFRDSWLKELANLTDLNKQYGKERELAYMKHFLQVFEELLETHHMQFESHIYDSLGKRQIVDFILSNFLIMLKRRQRNYEYFDLILKKILLP